MRLVVDASVAVKWLVAEDGSDAADRLLTDGDDLYAPRLMTSEVANTLWRKVRLGEIKRGTVSDLVVLPRRDLDHGVARRIQRQAAEAVRALTGPPGAGLALRRPLQAVGAQRPRARRRA